MKFGRKLAVFLAKKNMKHKDFAAKIKKTAEEVSYYINEKRKKPHKDTADLIVLHTEGEITLKDMGY